MPGITITKTKARRGSDTQRKLVVFDQGNIIYTVDTKRVFVGTGTTLGGISIAAKVHPLLTNYYNLSEINAQIGDLVNVNNLFYQLTATDYSDITSWANVGTKIDTTIFTYDALNTLTISNSALSAVHLDPNTVFNGLKIESGVLQVDYNTKSLELSANKLNVKSGGIGAADINATALSGGLIGGYNGISSSTITLDTNDQYFKYYGNKLSLNLNNQWIGDGLNITAGVDPLSTLSINVDDLSVELNASKQLSLTEYASASGSPEWSKMYVDKNGRIFNHQSSIYDTLTGNSTTNSNNSLSAIFNGVPSHTLTGSPSSIQLTNFTATDSSGATVSLSSAGWITFEGNTTSRTGESIGRFAIPIFAY